MNKIWGCLFLVIFSISSVFSQSISNSWQLEKKADSLISSNLLSKAAYLNLNEGQFSLLDNSEDTLATGDYLYQNKLLVFFYNQPKDTIQNLRVASVNDDSMVIVDGEARFSYTRKDQGVEEVIPAQTAKTIIPSQGISTSSILRGALGMLSLIFLAFVFSSKRKAINWKTVGIGLAAQLILAIGVLKITFVQNIFEFVGQIFVLILDFTAAGSEFLLGGMMDVDSFGFIFLFQVLPTIIFFSALTSVLFYFGVIQIVVKGMA